MAKIFLTGITGLVGSSFVTGLLKQRDDVEIVALTRAGAARTAAERVEDVIREQCALEECPELADKFLKSIEVIEGDVTDLVPEKFAALPELTGVDTVFHCAADVNLGKDPAGKTYRINYHGTENVIAVAKLLKVKALHYVCTAYIAGRLKGRAIEDRPINSGFHNPYEQSKYEAEMLVRKAGIPFSIYRPSIIIGRRKDGKIRRALAFYRILEFMAKLKKHTCSKTNQDPTGWVALNLHFSAANSNHIYFVPIDYIQESIVRLFHSPVCGKAFHITGDSPVSTLQILEAMCRVLKLRNVSVGADNHDPTRDEKLLTRFLGDLLPYFSTDIIFDQRNVREVAGDEILDWPIGLEGLVTMMRTYYRDFFPNVEWLQQLVVE
ncbi:MAG: SDR family oxidoreductase [Victivallaceae bacterium]|nr:SDR family oxidoreductase [Victivallaceae bacterium]